MIKIISLVLLNMNPLEKSCAERRKFYPRLLTLIYILFGYIFGIASVLITTAFRGRGSLKALTILTPPQILLDTLTDSTSLIAENRQPTPFKVIDHKDFNVKFSKIVRDSPIRICLATSMVAGPTHHGGIATAFYNMARSLAEERRNGVAVFNVTIYYAAHPFYAHGKVSYWIQKFAAWKINFVKPSMYEKQRYYGSKLVVRSFTALNYFLEHKDDFDIISFPDYFTVGYFTVLAKHQGLAFQNVSLMIQCHSTIRWTDEMNFRPPRGHDTLGYYYMEQKTVELADARISPSKYFLEWMANESHYDFSSGLSFVIQNLHYPLAQNARFTPKKVNTRHFAFFGRLEMRKGLMVFLEAVDFWLSTADSVKPSMISFLGPDTKIQRQRAVSIIQSHAANKKWNCSLKILTNLDTAQALAYLAGGVIAVLPTLSDNSPYVLVEMMMKGIPFITSDAGGGPELMKSKHGIVAANDHKALARAMADAAANGLLTNQMAVDPVQTKEDYVDTLISLAALNQRQSREPDVKEKKLFKVAIGVPTYNRCDVLLETIQSLANQDYPHDLLHIIIVDDASDDPATQKTLARAAEMLRAAGISYNIVIHNENQFVAASRNEIIEWSHSRRADFVCFMDDDDLALPEMISTYMKVATRTGADILTDVAEEYSLINGSWSFSYNFLAVGGTFAHNFVINTYGRSNFCAKAKEVYEMGGHHSGVKSRSPFVDWGFFTRASLNDLKIELVPLALYKYRKNGNQNMLKTRRSSQDIYYGHGKMLEDIEEIIPEKFHDVFELCRYSLGQPYLKGDSPEDEDPEDDGSEGDGPE